MKTESLPATTRMIVRMVALGLLDDDIVVRYPEYTAGQIAKMRAGQTFKRAVADLQEEIDQQVISQAAEDPTRAFLAGKSMSAAKVLAGLAENHDGETPHAVQSKAADSILAKAGYSAVQENVAMPVIMLSPDKLESVLNPKKMALDTVPDCVDGNDGDLDRL